MFLMERSMPENREASSVLVGRSLTRAATSEFLEVLSSPSEQADTAGECLLVVGLWREVELGPRGERPSPSMLMESCFRG